MLRRSETKPVATPVADIAGVSFQDFNGFDALYGDSGQISYSTPFATGQLGYNDGLASTFPYDPEKAKELLSDAGYPDGFAVKTMVVPFMYGDGAQAIAGQLSEVGITLELEDHAEDFFDQLTSGNWPMITFNFSIGTNPIRTYEGLSDPNGFWNTLHSVSPEIPGLLGDLNAASDEAERDAILAEIAIAFQQDSWYLVPTFVRGATAFNGEKLSVTAIPGAPVPYLYDIVKIG